MENKQVAGKISKKLADIMMQAKSVGKDSQNKQQGFNFRGIDAVMNHLHPIFAAHGVVILPNITAERTEERETKSGGHLIYRVLTVKFVFLADDGSSVSCLVIGEGMDTGDKAANKAMAVALKYALTQMLLLPYDEVDPDGETVPANTRKQVKYDPLPQPKAPAATKPSASKPATEPVPEPSGETGRLSIVVALGEVKIQTGKGSRGEWNRFYTKASDDQYYSTFDTNIGATMQNLSGEEVEITYRINKTPKGESRYVLEVLPVIDGAADQGAADDADSGSKGHKEMPF